MLLGYKPVQHVTVLNTVGNCNTMVLQYYNIMGTPSYMRSVVDRKVVTRRMTVITPVRIPHVRNCVLVLAGTSEPQDVVSTHLQSVFVMNTFIKDIPSALFLEHSLINKYDFVRTEESQRQNNIYVDWTFIMYHKTALISLRIIDKIVLSTLHLEWCLLSETILDKQKPNASYCKAICPPISSGR